MLHDPMLVDEVDRLIVEDRINAEWAVRRVARKLKHLFDNIPDEYFRERRSDVDYVADRIVRNLMGQVVDEEVEMPAESIVVAHDLSPVGRGDDGAQRAGGGLHHGPGRPDEPHGHRGAGARDAGGGGRGQGQRADLPGRPGGDGRHRGASSW